MQVGLQHTYFAQVKQHARLEIMIRGKQSHTNLSHQLLHLNICIQWSDYFPSMFLLWNIYCTVLSSYHIFDSVPVVVTLLSWTFKDGTINCWGLGFIWDFHSQTKKIKEEKNHQEGGGEGNIPKELGRSESGTWNFNEECSFCSMMMLIGIQ